MKEMKLELNSGKETKMIATDDYSYIGKPIVSNMSVRNGIVGIMKMCDSLMVALEKSNKEYFERFKEKQTAPMYELTESDQKILKEVISDTFVAILTPKDGFTMLMESLLIRAEVNIKVKELKESGELEAFLK